LDDPGFDTVRGKNVYLLQNVQVASVVHSASCLMVTGVEQPGRAVNQSPPSAVEVKIRGAKTLFPVIHILDLDGGATFFFKKMRRKL